jgi:hypothetical protein
MLKPGADHRRALELLAGSKNGCTEPVMLALGITRDLLADLILDGLASADAERMLAAPTCGASRSRIPGESRLNDDGLAGDGDRPPMARAASSGSSGCRRRACAGFGGASWYADGYPCPEHSSPRQAHMRQLLSGTSQGDALE